MHDNTVMFFIIISMTVWYKYQNQWSIAVVDNVLTKEDMPITDPMSDQNTADKYALKSACMSFYHHVLVWPSKSCFIYCTVDCKPKNPTRYGLWIASDQQHLLTNCVSPKWWINVEHHRARSVRCSLCMLWYWLNHRHLQSVRCIIPCPCSWARGRGC